MDGWRPQVHDKPSRNGFKLWWPQESDFSADTSSPCGAAIWEGRYWQVTFIDWDAYTIEGYSHCEWVERSALGSHSSLLDSLHAGGGQAGGAAANGAGGAAANRQMGATRSCLHFKPPTRVHTAYLHAPTHTLTHTQA
jgi:hypothetical protein